MRLAVASMSRKFFKVFDSLFVWYLYGLRRVTISLSGALSQLKRETHHVYIRIHAIKPFFPRFRWAACLDFLLIGQLFFPISHWLRQLLREVNVIQRVASYN